MTPWNCVLNGRQGEETESGVFCTLAHWEHSQLVCPEVTGSFEMAVACTDTGCWVARLLLGWLVASLSLFPGFCESEGEGARQLDAWPDLILDLVLCKCSDCSSVFLL